MALSFDICNKMKTSRVPLLGVTRDVWTSYKPCLCGFWTFPIGFAPVPYWHRPFFCCFKCCKVAILKEAEHQGNSSVLNTPGKESEIERRAFDKIRKEFWQKYAAGLL